MTDRVIPLRRLFELLRTIAAERGLRAEFLGAGLAVLCLRCYPSQPERLPSRWAGRADEPWRAVLYGECDGYVRIHHPLIRDLRDLVHVEEAVEALDVTACCHDPDDATGGWYWRTDLETWADDELTEHGSEWAAEWEALARRAREAGAQRAVEEEALHAAAALTLTERIQATGVVVKAAGHPAVIDQARVSWECGHVDHDGNLMTCRLIVSEGLPRVADDSCGLHEDPRPSAGALRNEFLRVAAMPPEERAKYRPVSPRKSGGGGRWGRRPSSGPSTPKKPRGEDWPVESTRSFFEGHGIDVAQGINKLMAAAMASESDEAKRPTKKAIIAMKQAP